MGRIQLKQGANRRIANLQGAENFTDAAWADQWILWPLRSKPNI